MTDPQHQNNPDGNPTYPYFGTQGSTGVKFDPNNFRIDAGVEEVEGNPGWYKYVHTSHEYISGVEIVFSASQKPILGDQVVNGVLVPRPIVPNNARNVFQNGMPKPIVNNDPGFQLKRFKRHQDTTWPDEKVWVDRVDTKW